MLSQWSFIQNNSFYCCDRSSVIPFHRYQQDNFTEAKYAELCPSYVHFYLGGETFRVQEFELSVVHVFIYKLDRLYHAIF